MANTNNKKTLPKRTIDVRVTALPSGEEAVTYNLEKSVQSIITDHNSAMARIIVGDAALGSKENSFLAKIKSNHQALFGDSNSIFALLSDIKAATVASKLDLKTITQLANKYLDSYEENHLWDESNYMVLSGIAPLLNDILVAIKEGNTTTEEGSQKIKLLIQGINDKTIDKLIELSERDIDPTSKNSRALKNFLLAISHFGEIDKKTTEGLETLDSLILPLNQVLKRIENLNKTLGDGQTLVDTVIRLQKLFAAIKEIKEVSLTKDDTDVIMYAIKGVNSILQEMSSANEILKDKDKMKDFESYIINLMNIFGDGSNLDILFEGLREMHPVSEEQAGLIIDGVTAINTILFNLKNLGIEADNIIPGNLSFLDFIFYSDQNPENLKNIFHGLNDVADMTNKEKYQRIVENIGHVKNIVDSLAQIKVNKKLPEILKELTTIFANTTENGKISKSASVKSLSEIFKGLNSIDVADQKKVEKIIKSLEGISSIINTLSNIDTKANDIKKMRVNILDYLDILDEVYDEIKTKYDKIIELAGMADTVKAANKKIDESLDSCNEVAVKTNQRNEEIKKASISMAGLGAFIVASAAVMTIGALFMMVGGAKFAKNALLFGVTLMAFEAMVVAPLLLFSLQKNKAFPALNNLNSFVITCTATMLVGALFMMLGGGKFMQAALGFAITLGLFEALIVAPIMTFKFIAKDALDSLENLSSFIITCTVIMTLGALFMSFAGGKLVKNALKFGLTLMLFEAIVVAPFILFNKYAPEATKGLQNFSGFLIVTTAVMLIGALFMSLSGGKLVKNALKFAFTLMLFEAMIITPFLLINTFKDGVTNSMKLFTGIVITSTIILMIGALFVAAQGGKYVKNALKFTGLLMLFEIGVLAPLLILNKMKNQIFRGLVDFTAMIIVCTTALLIGALFMTMKGGQMPHAALQFTGLLALFELAVVAPILLFSKVAPEAIQSAQQFGIFIALCTASLIAGAAYINAYGSASAWEFALLLAGFVGIMEAVAVGLSVWLNGKSMVSMKELSIFISVSSAALLIGAMFVKTYGAKSVMEYAIVLAGFVTIMEVTVLILNKFMGDPKTIASMSAFGIFVGLSSLALIAGAMYINKYGVGSAINYAIVLTGFIALMSGVMALLGYLAPYITPCIAVAQGLAIAIGTLSLSILLTNYIFENDPNGRKTLKHIGVLGTVLTGILGVFAILGIPPVMVLITLGAVAATAIGVAITAISVSLGIMHSFIGKNGNRILKEIGILNNILSWDSLGSTFLLLSALGLVAPLGLAASVAIGISLMALSASLAIVDSLMKKHGKTLPGNINTLIDIVGQIGILSLALIPVGVAAVLGNIAMIPIGLLTVSLSTTMLLISLSVAKMAAVGDISSQTETIVNNLKSFINIADEVISVKDIFKITRIFSKLEIIKSIAKPMGETMLTVASAIQDLANLKVASRWDKDGNAIRWRQLKPNDFEIAKGNIADILTTMAEAFIDVWYGKTRQFGLKDLANNDDEAIWQVLYFGNKVGEVISNIATGVGNMAKMQIPTAWDSKGKAIAFRQLKQKDFKLASDNVSDILISMASTIMSLYQVGNDYKRFGLKQGQNIFDVVGGGLFSDAEPSPFINTLEATLKIGEVISNIGSAVGNMAKMQIPTAWDEKGKAIAFRPIKKRDFVEAGENIDLILTSVVRTLMSLYEKGKNEELGGSEKQNIFDVVSGGLLCSDDPPKLIRVIEASMKVSEMISNIATGVKDIAVLQIPNQWDDKGHPIHYVKVTSSDFYDAGKSIENILTTVISAVASLDINTDDVSNKMDAILPVSEFIGNMAEGIVKLASGQIAINWNKDGKAIEYRQLTKDDYIAAGEAVEKILIGQIVSIVETTKRYPQYFGKDNEWFTEIVSSVSSTGGLISSIADSIIKIGQGLVADKWDKDGKPIHFKQIVYTDAINNLNDVMMKVIPATANAIILAYNGDDSHLGLKFILGENPDDDSPFNVAVRCINEITKITASVVDTAIKLGSAQVPDWDAPWKDGKPTRYKHIEPLSIINNVNQLFKGNGKQSGILTILADVISDIYDDYFAPGKKFDPNNEAELLTTVSNGISQILRIISSASNSIVKIASTSIPISWDKDGNVLKYVRLDDNEINRAKNIIKNIIVSLLTILDSDEIRAYQTEEAKNAREILADNITDLIAAIGLTVRTTLDQIKEINKYQDEINKFSTLDFTKMVSNLNNSISQLQGICSSFTYDPTQETVFDFLTDELSNYVYNGVNPFDKDAYDKSNLLIESIKKTNQTLSNAKGSSQFNQNTEILKKYVNTINSVDVSKLNTMNSLVNGLNKLANQWPDMGALTNALVEKLTPTLNNLVDRLEQAARTIEKSDESQDKRQKKIDSTISAIKEVMANPINVLVSSDTTDSLDDNNPSSPEEDKTKINNTSRNNSTPQNNGTPPQNPSTNQRGSSASQNRSRGNQ